MQPIDQLNARLLLLCAFGLPIATILCGSESTLAQGEQKGVSTSQQIEDEEANKINSNRITGGAASHSHWRLKFGHSKGYASCRLSKTSAAQHRELQDFLDGKSDCFAGYDLQ